MYDCECVCVCVRFFSLFTPPIFSRARTYTFTTFSVPVGLMCVMFFYDVKPVNEEAGEHTLACVTHA